MRNFFKGKIATAIVLLATFVLAGIAIFTAVRLYQLRQVSVSPTAPESNPSASALSCSLSFTLVIPTASPTPTTPPGGTASCQKITTYRDLGSNWPVLTNAQLTTLKAGDKIAFCVNGTSTVPITVGQFNNAQFTINDVQLAATQNATNRAQFGGFCQPYTLPATATGGASFAVTVQLHHTTLGSIQGGTTGACAVGFTLGVTPTATPTATDSATPTATPTETPTSPPSEPNGCNGTCGSNFNCQSSFLCYNGFCRNPECTTNTSCTCSGTPGPTGTPAPAASLPQSGTDWPTILGAGIGILTILGSLLLAI